MFCRITDFLESQARNFHFFMFLWLLHASSHIMTKSHMFPLLLPPLLFNKCRSQIECSAYQISGILKNPAAHRPCKLPLLCFINLMDYNHGKLLSANLNNTANLTCTLASLSACLPAFHCLLLTTHCSAHR